MKHQIVILKITLLFLLLSLIASCSIYVISTTEEISGSVSYPQNKYEEFTNVAVSLSLSNTITNATYDLSITPPLTGTGLSFNTNNGAISGTPMSASSNQYTVTATGTGDYIGSISDSIIIVIKERTPITGAMSYNGVIDNKYQGFTNVAVTFTLSEIVAGTHDLSIAPPLTDGLSFDSSSGTISGTPTNAFSNRYTVTATGTGDYIGSTNDSIIIVIKERKPIIGTMSYNGVIDNKYQGFTNVAVSLNLSNTITNGTYDLSIAPPLTGTGLSFDLSSGAINGTPTNAFSNRYTVTATGTGDYIDSTNGSIIIVIEERKAITGTMSYNGLSDNKHEEFTNVAVSLTLSETITGTYDLSIAPPLTGTGLSFDLSSGAINGTPTNAFSNRYTVTATGTGDYIGSISDSIIIVIEERKPITGTVSYNGLSGNKYEDFTNAVASLSLSETITGTYDLSITPSLTGTSLSFNPATGAIGGTTSTIPSSNRYTVTATGTGDYTGSISASLIIAIFDGYTPFTIVEKDGNPAVLTIRNNDPSKRLFGATNWSSSDTSVATVTDGVVRFAETTTLTSATITATIGVYSTNKEVSVESSTVDGSGNVIIIKGSQTNLVISDSTITIVKNAFSHSTLTSVIIPDSVETIDESAFAYSTLTSITIGTSVKTIGVSAFLDNKLLTSVIIPDSVETISARAFQLNKLTNVIIGTSVKTIGESAFAQNFLTSVKIPESMTNISNSAFRDNPSLTNVTLSKVLYDSLGTERETVFGSQVQNWYKLDGSPQ